MFNVKPYAKAVVAALVAGASFAIPVIDDGLVPSEVLGIAVATLTAFGVVFAVPNQAEPEGPDPEDFQAKGYMSGV